MSPVCRHQHAAAGNQIVRIQLEALANLHGLLTDRNSLQVDLQADAGRLRHLPKRAVDAALGHVVHGADAVLHRNLRIFYHGNIPVKALGRLHECRRETFPELLFLLFGNDRGALHANPFGHQDILAGLRPCSGYQLSLLHLAHACDADNGLIDCPGDLGVAAHDLDMELGAGRFHFAHHLLNVGLLDLLGQKHCEHDAHRLRAAAGQIVCGNLDSQSADILHRSGNGIGGNHENLAGSQLHSRAVLAHAGAQKHLVPLRMYLLKNTSL